jgi:regulator of RNase E activity RraB
VTYLRQSIVDFPSVTSMVAATTHVDGDLVKTLGYYVAGDGGGNSYIYHAAGRPTADGGFYIDGPGADDYFEAVDKTIANIRQFGAQTFAENNASDAGPPIGNACAAAMAHNGSVFIPSSGDSYYRVATKQTIVTSSLEIKCDTARIQSDLSDPEALYFIGEQISQPSFDQAAANRGDFTIDVSDATGISAGDLLTIVSNVIWATTTNYTKAETHLIESVSGNTLTLVDSLIFNYDTAGTPTADVVSLEAYKRGTLNLNGRLTCHSDPVGKKRIIRLSHLVNSTVRDLYLYDPEHQLGVGTDIFFVSQCYGLTMQNIEIEGGRYPISVGRSRNIVIDGVTSRYVWHPVDFNTCYNCQVKNITGFHNQSTIETHDSFLIHYENVTCLEGKGYSLRCVGGSMKNCFIQSSQAIGTNYMLNTVFNTAESSVDDLHPQYDFLAENITIDFSNAVSGGQANLGYNQNARIATFKNCKVSQIRQGGGTGNAKVVIDNCYVNHVWTRQTETKINDTTFVADHPLTEASQRLTDRALRFTGGNRQVAVSNCLIQGYDHVCTHNAGGLDIKFTGNQIESIATDFFKDDSSTNTNYFLTLSGNSFADCILPMQNGVNINTYAAGNFADDVSQIGMFPGSKTYSSASATVDQFANATIDSSANAVALTLNDGKHFEQQIAVVMSDASNVSTLSVTSHETSSPEVFTFNAVGQTVVLIWNNVHWATIKSSATP